VNGQAAADGGDDTNAANAGDDPAADAGGDR
jgi:hypothetical protein